MLDSKRAKSSIFEQKESREKGQGGGERKIEHQTQTPIGSLEKWMATGAICGGAW
jgi:hypothetical protein